MILACVLATCRSAPTGFRRRRGRASWPGEAAGGGDRLEEVPPDRSETGIVIPGQGNTWRSFTLASRGSSGARSERSAEVEAFHFGAGARPRSSPRNYLPHLCRAGDLPPGRREAILFDRHGGSPACRTSVRLPPRAAWSRAPSAQDLDGDGGPSPTPGDGIGPPRGLEQVRRRPDRT